MLLALATTQLAACTNTGSESKPDLTKDANTAKINAAIDQTIEKSGGVKAVQAKSLIALEKEYKENSADPTIAYQYAKALRQADYANRASTVLTPFVHQPTIAPNVNREMSSIELALGNFRSAEKYAQQAVLQDPEDFQAYQNLGVSLDAQGKYPAAERAFRKGLETWKGDPTVIMNNLALNLATQNYLDEAVEILEKAKAISPDRIEIERNLRIVKAMKER